MRAAYLLPIAMALPLAACVTAPPRPFAFTDAAGRSVLLADGPAYTPVLGYGFEGAAGLRTEAGAQSERPFFFSADVPEGDHRVTVTLGGASPSTTTVKAELRRLMLEAVPVRAGGSEVRSFIVNVRRPAIAGGGAVRLKTPRESEQEAVAWDDRITLEFNGRSPAVRSIAIAPVTVPTIYLLGDSTVTDQSAEPYASWGQMLPAFFTPTVAVANHGQSGESVSSANDRDRFAKIMSLIKPGDVFVVQFGHNDMKEMARDPQAPPKYRDGLIAWAKAVQARGASAVIVTPMNRYSFRGGVVVDSLAPYPQMAREAARATGAVLIDLNASSKVLYEALGEQGALELFKHNADGSGRDGTHHSPYGAYQLARIVVEGLRGSGLPIARAIRPDLPRFDPARPDSAASFSVPPSPTYTDQRPLGD